MAGGISTLYVAFTWLVFGGGIGLFAGVVLAILWSPFLLSSRVQQLFAAGPFQRWSLNYVATGLVMGVIHFGVMLMLLGLWGSTRTVLDIVFGIGTGIPLLAWLIGVRLVRRSHSATEYGVWTHLLLGLGVLWYAVVTIVPPLFFTIFYYLPS